MTFLVVLSWFMVIPSTIVVFTVITMIFNNERLNRQAALFWFIVFALSRSYILPN
jgi:FtsH-binding integral membrane protein